MKVKMTVFCDIALFSLVEVDRRFSAAAIIRAISNKTVILILASEITRNLTS
jgi:hypothetical protein